MECICPIGRIVLKIIAQRLDRRIGRVAFQPPQEIFTEETLLRRSLVRFRSAPEYGFPRGGPTEHIKSAHRLGRAGHGIRDTPCNATQGARDFLIRGHPGLGPEAHSPKWVTAKE